MLHRITKRVRQFHRAVFSGMDRNDHELVDKFLDRKEKDLFYRMAPPVQKHCVNVTREILIATKGQKTSDSLIKAALIHDLGKLKGSFSLIDRVLFVVLTKLSLKLVKRLAASHSHGFLGRMRYAFYVHLNHEEIGAQLAEKSGLPQDIVFLIANHHNRVLSSGSRELSFLLAADELN